MADEKELDFATLFENSVNVNMSIRNGDKVKGTVIAIDKSNVFINLGGRQDGVMDVKDFQDADGNLTVQVGDEVEAFVAGSDSDGIRLRRSIGARAQAQIDTAVAEAFQSKIPIEGKVTGERKGGYTVQISKLEGFCPISQIDARGVKGEAADYIGNSYNFIVTEYSEDGRNLVVSRRRVLEEEAASKRQKLLATLEEGVVLDGVVTNVMPYGAFVDLGGVEGMIHVSELSWDRNTKPEEVVKSGDRVTVKVLSVERGEGKQRDRIALSLKKAALGPWEKLAQEGTFQVGVKYPGKVTRLAEFGAFIQLAPGLEGLAHISQLGATRRVNHPSDVLKVGQAVEVTVLDIDFEAKRISLCIGEPKVKPQPSASPAAPVAPPPPEDNDYRDSGNESFGGLGDLFGNIKL